MNEPELVRSLHDEGRYKEALRVAARVLRIQPREAETLLWVSSCHAVLGHPRRATRYARRAVAANPENVHIRAWLAQTYADRNDRRRALRTMREALALEPENIDLHRKLALLHVTFRQHNKAIETIRAALKLDPENRELLQHLSDSLLRQGRHGEAREAALSTLRLDPEEPPGHAQLGWTELVGGDTGAAVSHFREALRLDPTDESAREGFLEAVRARRFLYRWVFRVFFRISSLHGVAHLSLIAVVWLGLGALVTVTKGTSIESAVAFGGLAVVLTLHYGHHLWKPVFDLLFRFDPRLRRFLTLREVLKVDLLASLLAAPLLFAIVPLPAVARLPIVLTLLYAAPLGHAISWPHPAGRRALRGQALLLLALPLLAIGILARTCRSPVALVGAVQLALFAWGAFWLLANRRARLDGV